MKKHISHLTALLMALLLCIPSTYIHATGSDTSDSQINIANPRIEYCAKRECVYFGNFYQEDTNGNGTADDYDAKTPVKWQILEEAGDELLLISDKVLYYAQYNGQKTAWKDSALRSILNNQFIHTAFSEEEANALVENHLTDYTSTGAADDTMDKVYILSYDEVKQYMPENELAMAEYSPYFKAQNIQYTNCGGDTTGIVTGNASWWLRTAGTEGEVLTESGNQLYFFRQVTADGTPKAQVHQMNGVRPVIRINKTKLSSPLTRTEKNVGIRNVEYDRISFGSYNNSPIIWRVHEVKDNEAFLLSEDVLDYREFHDVYEERVWDNCTLRSWLNDDFYNSAFNENEQAAILTSYVHNDNPEIFTYKGVFAGADRGRDSYDKIYLPSYTEMTTNKYGFSFNSRVKDKCRATNGSWLLRNSIEKCVGYGFKEGSIWAGTLDINGDLDNSGIRPVLHLNLDSDVWEKCDVWSNQYKTKYITDRNVRIYNSNAYYTGREFKPLFTITIDDTQLIEGIDYTVEYQNNIEVGTATAIIKGTEIYHNNIRYVGSSTWYYHIIAPYEKPENDQIISYPIDVKYGQSEARLMTERINSFRTGQDSWYWNEDNTEKIYANNLKPLNYDYHLEEVAMKRAAEIALYYSHSRPNGDNYSDTAFRECQYYPLGRGENIAYGYTTEENIYTAWLEEDELYEGQGHRRNMLYSDFKSVGIGHVVYNGRHFWVQEFSTYTSNDSVTPAADEIKTVDIDIYFPYITITGNDSSEINMKCGETIDVTTLDIKPTLTGLHNIEAYLDNLMTADDFQLMNNNDYVSFDGRYLKALNEGVNYLYLTKYGKTITINVTPAAATAEPTATPIAGPTVTPTVQPTATPIAGPTNTPTATAEPTPTMTPANTPIPTESPMINPTAEPVITPTAAPTAASTVNPTSAPTKVPMTPTIRPASTPVPESKLSQTIKLPAKYKKVLTYKYKILKHKKITFKPGAKAKTPITYKLIKGNRKNILISSGGKITLKKGCRKGIYKISLTAIESNIYTKATGTITIKVK